MNINNLNIMTIAYLGDAVYELYIRKYLIKKNISMVNELQKEAIKYVSAKGQANILSNLISNNLLTNEEIDIVKRGRNYKRSTHPKNTNIITYKKSSGFEALIGYLYLRENYKRIEEILKYIEVD